MEIVAWTGARVVQIAAYAMGQRATRAKVIHFTVAQMNDLKKIALKMGLLAAFLLSGASDCQKREEPKRRGESTDGGIVTRPECKGLGGTCLMECARRSASPACTRCCMDQDHVCNDGGKADFDSCKGSR